MFKPILFSIVAFLTINTTRLSAQDWGIGNTRTEYRDNAGVGTKSGFYESQNPVNFPPMYSSWWLLMDIRHSNTAYNHAMQFAGGFFDQHLYFRKTNNSATTPWSRVLLERDNKVGIGTINPTAALQIGDFATGTNAQKIVMPGVYNIERVALGQDGNGNSSLEFVNHSDANVSYGIKVGTNIDKYGGGLYIATAASTNDYSKLSYRDQPAIFANANDNSVGIGTNATYGYRLAVAGPMIAERIKVKQVTNWPDYVFKKDYQLPPLKEVATFIDKNGHLPGIPSAAEIANDGIEVGDMNARLLQKIEEMTLHLIQQQ